MDIKSDLKQARRFRSALIVATVLPIVIAIAYQLGFLPKSSLSIHAYFFLVVFVSLAHVPSTIFLFFDHDLVKGGAFSALDLYVVPLILVIGPPILLYSLSPLGGGDSSFIVFYFWMLFFSWQHWHFGRQNLGVHAFCRMTENRGRMSDFERRTLNLAALSGALVIYAMFGEKLRQRYVESENFNLHDSLLGGIMEVGMVIQVAITLSSIIYVAVNRRSFSLSTATIYLCGVSFFFPMYFMADFLPPLYVVAHAFQYMIFLSYNATGRTALAQESAPPSTQRDKGLPEGIKRFGKVYAHPILLLIIFGLGGMFLMSEEPAAGFIHQAGLATNFFDIPVEKALLLVIGFHKGITFAHFWYDSLFWKLGRPSQRAWAQKRYPFIFSAR